MPGLVMLGIAVLVGGPTSTSVQAVEPSSLFPDQRPTIERSMRSVPMTTRATKTPSSDSSSSVGTVPDRCRGTPPDHASPRLRSGPGDQEVPVHVTHGTTS
jgi:hypothetical protein